MGDLTLRITDRQINFIRLVDRSPDAGDGWRRVSGSLADFVRETAAEQPELYETQEEDGALMIRFSERGAILRDYVSDARAESARGAAQ